MRVLRMGMSLVVVVLVSIDGRYGTLWSQWSEEYARNEEREERYSVLDY